MEKFTRAYERFKRAFQKFREVADSQFLPDIFKEEFLIEITTKRFEYTYEALWKTLKELLRLQGLECNSPKSCFKEAFKEGLIDGKYEEVFFEMIALRNRLVHIYDEEMAKEVYLKLKNKKFLLAFEDIAKKIEDYKRDEL